MSSRANGWYGIGIVSVTIVSLIIPYILGTFIPCAQFMEIEWIMVFIICLACVGGLNIYFSIAPALESFLPKFLLVPVRGFVLVVIPILVIVWSIYMSFSPFWWALLNDPDLICD